MPADTGMLFDLGYEHTVQVTTAEMLFNIDIAFISVSQEVVDIARDVAPGNIVTSVLPTAYFLEVNAGELANVELGDHVAIAFFPGELPMETFPWAYMFQQLLVFVLVMGFMMWMVREVTTPALDNKKPGIGEMELLSQVYLSEEALKGKIAEMERKMQLETDRDKHQLYAAAKRGYEQRLAGMKESYPKTKHRRPRRNKVEVVVWEERDRLHVGVREKDSGEYPVDWWDDEARQMFEDGFFEPMGPGAARRRRFEESVLDYAEQTGFILPETEGVPRLVGPKSKQPREGPLEFYADSVEHVAQTVNGTGYRPQLDQFFQEAIARAGGMKKVSEGFKELF